MSTLDLERLADRCAHGYAEVQHPALCQCVQVPAVKAEGIGRANHNAPADVKDRVDAAIRRMAATREPFSANDLRVELEGVAGPVVGGRFNAAARAGLIRDTRERVPSNLASTHGHEVRVWIGVTSHP